jgi:hypothetical protein
MKTLLQTHDPEYEGSDILKHSTRLGFSVGHIVDADGHPLNIFVRGITGL